MWLNLIETKTSRALEQALDVSAYRSQLLAQNAANENTPNYKRVDLDFSRILNEAMITPSLAMTKTHVRHLEGGESATGPLAAKDGLTSMRYDGNNVDIDYEMAKIAENTMYFQALSSSWRGQMNRLKMVIEGRG